jgi:hypothetical protein
MDFLTPESGNPAPSGSERAGLDFAPTIVIMPDRNSPDRWRALWAYDSANGHEEFEGTETRADRLVWSKVPRNPYMVVSRKPPRAPSA